VSQTFRSLASRAWNGFLAYVVKFGVVGLIGLVIDVVLFNALRIGVFGEGTWAQSAIGAKTISTSVAIVFNWLGNRYWTFRRHRRRHALREFAEYAVVSVGGMAIALLCLWISHYVLGYTSLLADNIATNVVGLALGTAFRFLLYRYWVFGHHRADGLSNLARVEEAQRALFEEPSLEPVPGAGGTAPAPAPAPAATPPRPGTTAGTPRRGSSTPPPAAQP
jgi:putative flippase GtrA